MNRREFLGAGAAVGALAATGGLAGCAPGGEQSGSEAVQAGGQAAASVPSFELDEITVDQLQEAMASGRWTARDITSMYLERIALIDRQGPSLQSVIETNPDALDIAGALDRERAEGSVRGPLHGIPILVKDNIATADRMTTTAGSLALEGSVPPEDSFIAARLRAAGAVILGKANLSEWANFRSSNSSSGWSGRGGQCKNPYALDRNPCGSSSGSGAAVSANLCAIAIGTETNGSIVCPSSANGVVGIKPTLGVWSRFGIIPIAHSQDTAGPMARTVRDAAILLGPLTGTDSADPETTRAEGNVVTDYTQFLDPDGLRGARIGIVRDFLGWDARVDALMEEAIAAMGAAGAVIVDPVEIPHRREINGPASQVLSYEFKADLNAYLAWLGPNAPVKSMEQVIAFNEANRERSMPYFGQERMLQAQEKGPLTDPEYLEALATAKRLSGPEGIDAVMEAESLDALVGSTGGPAWVTDLVNGDHFGGSSSSPAAIAGYPNITLPMGHVFGLPVGISFFGRAWSEGTLIRIAHGFEQTTGHRTKPEFRPVAVEY
jgi:amidase